MIREMEEVDGVRYVLGLESVTDAQIPEEMLPDQVLSMLKSDRWELMMIRTNGRKKRRIHSLLSV